MARHADLRTGQDHVLPALESALASLALAAGPINPPTECGPALSRITNCVVVASAVVADPRTTQQVLDFVRWLANPLTGPGPTMPVLATITTDEQDRWKVTVNFLRN